MEVCVPVTLDEVVVQKVDGSGIGSVRGAKLKGMVLVGLEEFRGIHLLVYVCDAHEWRLPGTFDQERWLYLAVAYGVRSREGGIEQTV